MISKINLLFISLFIYISTSAQGNKLIINIHHLHYQLSAKMI